MPSLDGHSLNEKMDREFKEIHEQIEILKFRIETEMRDMEKRFKELTVSAQTKSLSSKKKIKKELLAN